MISFKKTYVKQLLQLALALSLLRVDPESYIGWSLESQYALQDGDGWQLEIRSTPLTDYPYANRKTVIPLIEDLVRYDRQRDPYDVTAYLLNVQDEETKTQNETATNNVLDVINTERENRTITSSPLTLLQDSSFLISDPAIEGPSIIEQNLADLFDFGELATNNLPVFSLPIKEEHEHIYNIKRERASTSFSFSEYDAPDSPESDYGGILDWDDYLEVKKEIKEETDEISDLKEVKENTITSTVELTQEESELIEVLWKQDVDLGFTLTPPAALITASQGVPSSDDEVEKLKALLEIKNDKPGEDRKEDEEILDDPWAGVPFTIDAETGEYIQLDESILEEALQLANLTAEEVVIEDIPSIDVKVDEILADTSPISEEIKEFEETVTKITESEKAAEAAAAAAAAVALSSIKDDQQENSDKSLTESRDLALDDTDELENLICDMMIQTSTSFQHPRTPQNYHHGHGVNTFRQSSYHHQSRVPLSRAVSMEQRWQDLANLLSLPPGMGVGMGVGVSEMPPPHSHPHFPSHYPYQGTAPLPAPQPQFGHHTHPHSHTVLHNASLADLGGPTQPHYGPNLGSAVSTSMHLTNSSSETDAGANGYKMDHDMMYFSNASTELNHTTTDGFLNSILNDEDLQLMDMAVNDSMYTMRMLDHNNTSNNSSVLGGASGGSHGSSGVGILPPTIQTQLSSLGGSVVGNTMASHNGDRLDASSDSAVSSMGSERVPSLSDGEWGDAGSDSAQEYHQSKYGGPYDYSYNGRLGDGTRQPPVAQKKHHMFAKRYFQEQNTTIPANDLNLNQVSPRQQIDQVVAAGPLKYEYEPYGMHQHTPMSNNLEGAVGPVVITKQEQPQTSNIIQSEMKYSCSLDFTRQTRTMHDIVNHNHSYTLPHDSGSSPRPQTRDKKMKKAEEEHLTRDEKRARSLQVPMPVNEIINLPMDEFNERLSKYDLSETQLSLIRDIRRRGKNKVAAQNCRKRKLDQILSLADEVEEVRKRKERLLNDHDLALAEQKRVMDKFSSLYRHVFQYLRDPDGNTYSQSQYSLQQSADGSVFLLPRDNKQDNNSTNHSHNNHQGGPPHHHHHHNHHHHHQHHQKE